MTQKTENQKKYFSISLKKVIYSLESGIFSKLICGAANTNQKQVERLALIYSLAGINVIDVSLETYISAKIGINKAKEIYKNKQDFFVNFNEPLIMVSLNAGDDPHFKKAQINFNKCVNCLNCIKICSAKALYQEFDILKFNIESCFGCGKCINFCEYNAINLVNLEKDKIYNEFYNEIEAIEIHIGQHSVEVIEFFLKNQLKLFSKINLVSFSISASLFSMSQLIEYANSITKLTDKKVIIQLDGASMSATNHSASDIQAIAAANILVNSKINAYIQISGGTNYLTRRHLELFDLKISGIAYGTYARKIIFPYIEEVNKDFLKNLKKYVNIAANLIAK
ncbi:MAG: LdpA C-terminal domain-containing domain [bacterium]